MHPFLVRISGELLGLMQRATPFALLVKYVKPRSDDHRAGLTEVWVVVNGVISLVTLLAQPLGGNVSLALVTTVYAAMRVLEVISFQFYTQILGGYPGLKQNIYYSVYSLRRSIVLAIILYGEVIVWFAGIYRRYPANFKSELPLSSVSVALYHSVVTMSTVGYGDITPRTVVGLWIAIVQILVGIFMTVMIVARVVSYLPKPMSRDPCEQDPETDASAMKKRESQSVSEGK